MFSSVRSSLFLFKSCYISSKLLPIISSLLYYIFWPYPCCSFSFFFIYSAIYLPNSSSIRSSSHFCSPTPSTIYLITVLNAWISLSFSTFYYYKSLHFFNSFSVFSYIISNFYTSIGLHLFGLLTYLDQAYFRLTLLSSSIDKLCSINIFWLSSFIELDTSSLLKLWDNFSYFIGVGVRISNCSNFCSYPATSYFNILHSFSIFCSTFLTSFISSYFFLFYEISFSICFYLSFSNSFNEMI